MNTYFTRSSVFTVWLRPAGTDESGSEYAWAPINEQFVIQGKRPVDQSTSSALSIQKRGSTSSSSSRRTVVTLRR